MTAPDLAGYRYPDAAASHTHAYLYPVILRILSMEKVRPGSRLFELGCGNGALAADLAARGYAVVGVDPSEEGITIARNAHPLVTFEKASAYDDLNLRYGTFPVVLSLEVVEHLYAPRTFASTLFSLLEPNGLALISTPYHGYLKNLALALAGRFDSHFTALWDHGHIKFWSIRTLGALLTEAGFIDVRFLRVGRVPPLAKSMIAIARKPA